MKTMNAPVMSRLHMTARGTLRSGFFASLPSVVALSKPTRLKMQMTIAKSMPLRPAPWSLICWVSTVKPCLKRTTPASARMHATESPSSTSVSSDDTRMSFHAIVRQTAPLIAKRK